MSPGIRGKRVSSMRMPTVNPYWLKPPRTRPLVMGPTLPPRSARCTLGSIVKIDVFPHILPRRYFDRMLEVAPAGVGVQKGVNGIPGLGGLALPQAIMGRFQGH